MHIRVADKRIKSESTDEFCNITIITFYSNDLRYITNTGFLVLVFWVYDLDQYQRLVVRGWIVEEVLPMTDKAVARPTHPPCPLLL
jgi:hypothetical protein